MNKKQDKPTQEENEDGINDNKQQQYNNNNKVQIMVDQQESQ